MFALGVLTMPDFGQHGPRFFEKDETLDSIRLERARLRALVGDELKSDGIPFGIVPTQGKTKPHAFQRVTKASWDTYYWDVTGKPVTGGFGVMMEIVDRYVSWRAACLVILHKIEPLNPDWEHILYSLPIKEYSIDL